MDKIPEMSEMRYEPKVVDEYTTLYFAELEGYVSFYASNNRDHNGFGGQTYELTLKDGSTTKLVGPWSGRPGVMNKEGFTPSCDVVYTTNRQTWMEGSPNEAGNITIKLALEVIDNFLPQVVTVIETSDLEPRLNFRRVSNPCEICKGAGCYTLHYYGRLPEIVKCLACRGTGHKLL